MDIDAIVPAIMRIDVLALDGVFDTGLTALLDVFNTANELAGTRPGEEPPYEVQFLSLDGGSVPSSSAARIWTDRIDTRYGTGFDVLFIAGGHGAHEAARDQRLLGWLRSVQAQLWWMSLRWMTGGRNTRRSSGFASFVQI